MIGPGIRAPFDSQIGRCELGRYLSGFIVAGAVRCEFLKFLWCGAVLYFHKFFGAGAVRF